MKISTLIPVIREMHTSYLALITSRREIIAGGDECDNVNVEDAMNVITKIQLWIAQSMLFTWEYLFSNDWAAIIRENFDKQPWNENGEHFAIYSTTRHVGAKGEWRVRNWLTRSNTLQNNIIISLELLRVFSEMEIYVKHSSL